MKAAPTLPARVKLAFGIGASAEATIALGFNTWCILFYNQVLGLSGTLSGAAVTISLVLDAVSEPIVGALSDRTRSRLGRRHPFLYGAPIPLAVSFALLYMPPRGLTELGLFAWLCVFSTLHRQALTLFQVPHLALGAELATDYHQRSVVMSYAAIFGTLGASATFFFGWTHFSHSAGGTTARENYGSLALGLAVAVAAVGLASAYFTRDRIAVLSSPHEGSEPFSFARLLRDIRSCLQSRNYRATLAGLMCLSATVGVRETVHSYVTLFFWELPANKLRVFGLATPPAFLVAFLITARLHRRFDKRATMLWSLVVMALASVVPVLLRLCGWFPPNGSSALTAALWIFTFVYFGAGAIQMITVLSILGDIADEHELEAGMRSEGTLFAARTLFSKMSSGLGHLLAGVALDVIQFPTKAQPGQVAHKLTTELAVFDGPIASLPVLGALWFYRGYALDRQRHAEIARTLLRRRAEQPPTSAPASHAVPIASAVGQTGPAGGEGFS